MYLNENNEFITPEGTHTGVVATFKRGRWQYRSLEGHLMASGMPPARFCERFWYRKDYVEAQS